jgi:hypothetical protein
MRKGRFFACKKTTRLCGDKHKLCHALVLLPKAPERGLAPIVGQVCLIEERKKIL